MDSLEVQQFHVGIMQFTPDRSQFVKNLKGQSDNVRYLGVVMLISDLSQFVKDLRRIRIISHRNSIFYL